MKHPFVSPRFKHLLAGVIVSVMTAGLFPSIVRASTWSPTLLVNTEAFQIIDDGDGATNIELRFGDTANEILRWDVANARFQFTDDVHIEGNITGSGTLITSGAISTKSDLTINSDAGAADAVFTFGSDSTNETLTFKNAEDRFEFSDDVAATGNLTASGTFKVTGAATLGSTLTIGGVTYTFPTSDGTASGKVLATDSAGQLSWTAQTASPNLFSTIAVSGQDNVVTDSTSDTLTFAAGNNVTITTNATTDTVTIAATDTNTTYGAGQGLTLGSTTFSVNATLTGTLLKFGTVSGALLVHARDKLSSSGTLLVGGAAVLKSTLDTVGTITTDADLTINEDNGAADAVLTFGNDAGAETFTFSNTSNNFELSDDLDVTGGVNTTTNITTDANLTINEDNGTADAILTFGSDGTAETLTFKNAEDRFEFSDDLNATGNITGSGTLITSGAISTKADLTINSDSGTADAVFTFGSDSTNETLTFKNAEDRFEFSDDVAATGNITGSGTFKVTGAATLGSTLRVGGVTYTFPTSDGSASGKVLATNSAGQLSWTSIKNGSGNTVALSPEYPNAVYYASGSSFVGQLFASGGNLSSMQNNYTWKTTSAALQDYWISTRVKIPHNFSSWAPTPIQFRFKTGTDLLSQNHVTMKFYDTNNAQVALGTGAMAGTNWTTANITGPQGAGTYTPDSYITILVKLASTNTASAQANAGYINLNWRTTSPSG